MNDIRVGIFAPVGAFASALEPHSAAFARITDSGVDHVCVGDHVSFHVGAGADALIDATSVLTYCPELPCYVALYLLPLRHPVLVARQLASIAQLAPGRLTLGVGIGGEDPHELEICGVNPRTVGRRMDESLQILRALSDGEPVSYDGEFFSLRDALIIPAPAPSIPLIIGGRSEAAVRRAGRFGDGWLGIWVSPKRFSSVVEQIDEHATRAGRDPGGFEHAINVWCGFGATRDSARASLAAGMQELLPNAVRAVRAVFALRDARGGRGFPPPVHRGRLLGLQRDSVRHRPRNRGKRSFRVATTTGGDSSPRLNI